MNVMYRSIPAAPSSAKFANTPPPGQMPNAPPGGGGGWAQLELTDALFFTHNIMVYS